MLEIILATVTPGGKLAGAVLTFLAIMFLFAFVCKKIDEGKGKYW